MLLQRVVFQVAEKHELNLNAAMTNIVSQTIFLKPKTVMFVAMLSMMLKRLMFGCRGQIWTQCNNWYLPWL